MVSLFRCEECNKLYVCNYPNKKCWREDINRFEDGIIKCVCLKCLRASLFEYSFYPCNEREASSRDIIILSILGDDKNENILSKL